MKLLYPNPFKDWIYYFILPLPLLALAGWHNHGRAIVIRPFIPVGDVHGLAVLHTGHTLCAVFPRETRVFQHKLGQSRSESLCVFCALNPACFLNFVFHGLLISQVFKSLEVF